MLTITPRRSSARLVAGRYLLLDRIGEGGTGTVWRARDQRTDHLVALKILGRHDDDLLVRFVREQGVRIRHPHVVAPTGWVADDETAALSMDLVAGGSVMQLLAQHGPLPEGFVAVLLDQLLQALGAVHAAGVVHRDVKPGNLLLEPSADRPVLRLADFGVAATLSGDRFTHAPGAIGTDGFMAPEQEAGAMPDPRADLYSVGAVGVHLLTGVHPTAHTALPPGRLRPLLERLLADDPRARPANAEHARQLLHRLRVAWTGGPAVPDRLGPPGDRRTPDRHRQLLWAVTATGFSIGAGCALWLLMRLL